MDRSKVFDLFRIANIAMITKKVKVMTAAYSCIGTIHGNRA